MHSFDPNSAQSISLDLFSAILSHNTCIPSYSSRVSSIGPLPGGDGLFMVVDEQSNFKEDNFNTAMSVLKNAGDAAKGDAGNIGKKGGTKGESNCYKVLLLAMRLQHRPTHMHFAYAHTHFSKRSDKSNNRVNEWGKG